MTASAGVRPRGLELPDATKRGTHWAAFSSRHIHPDEHRSAWSVAPNRSRGPADVALAADLAPLSSTASVTASLSAFIVSSGSLTQLWLQDKKSPRFCGLPPCRGEIELPTVHLPADRRRESSEYQHDAQLLLPPKLSRAAAPKRVTNATIAFPGAIAPTCREPAMPMAAR